MLVDVMSKWYYIFLYRNESVVVVVFFLVIAWNMNSFLIVRLRKHTQFQKGFFIGCFLVSKCLHLFMTSLDFFNFIKLNVTTFSLDGVDKF